MGRDARIKRERRRAAKAPPPPVVPIPETNLEIVTSPPLPGCEDNVADDGYLRESIVNRPPSGNECGGTPTGAYCTCEWATGSSRNE